MFVLRFLSENVKAFGVVGCDDEAHVAHMAGIRREGVTTGLLKCLKCARS